MYTMGRDFVITKECVENPNFRNKFLDFFNKECRPINIALSANVRILPEKKTEKVLFMHPDNLAMDISEKMKDGRVETASITFNENTRVIDVCMGKNIELIIYLNSKDYCKE